jgi:hypothetical protein
MFVEIFKSGTHTDSAGVTREFKEEDLQNIVKKYNEKVEESNSFEAPLVKGHPKSDEPAFGWVEKLQYSTGKIIAKLKDVSATLIDEVKKGMFKKISIALYPDMMLRHVGILGAVPPAVQGMKNVKFAESTEYQEYEQKEESKDNVIEFQRISIEKLKEKNEKLEAQVEGFEKKEKANIFEMSLDVQIGDGKITPAQKTVLMELYQDLHDAMPEDKANKAMKMMMDKMEAKIDLTKNLNIDHAKDIVNYNGDESDRGNLDTSARALMAQRPEITYEQAVIELTSKKK